MADADEGSRGRQGYRHPREAVGEHELRPHAITEEDGSFEFLTLGTGIWKLYVRPVGAPRAMAPVRVELPPRGRERVQTLHLSTASIRATLRPEDKRVRYGGVRLYPVERPPMRDPYGRWGRASVSTASRELYMPYYDVRNGQLEIPSVPPGRYLLTFGQPWYPERLIRLVDVGVDQSIDLGTITPNCVPVQFTVDTNVYTDVAFDMSIPDTDETAFVTSTRMEAGMLETRLAPGHYVVTMSTPGNSLWFRPVNPKKICVQVFSDGRVEPSRLVYRHD